MTLRRAPLFATSTGRTSVKATKTGDTPDLGVLPEWNLNDLYASPTAPEVERDLAKAAKLAQAFADKYRGKLATIGGDGSKLIKALHDMEDLSDLLGKLGSYAGLLYAANQTDPERVQFYGNISEKLTEISTNLIFFDLELNQIAEEDLAQALKHKELKRYAAWFEAVRKEKPYQLEEKLEKLFHEKGQTGREAWGRLFGETMTGLRFDVAGEKGALTLEPTLNLLSDPKEPKRRAAAEALAAVFQDNIRLFTLITNTLAKDKEISDRWRGFKDVADSRHLGNRVDAPVVDALVAAVRAAYPRLSHRYYAMKARWLGLKRMSHWDRNAPLPDKPERVIAWPEAEQIVLGAYGAFAPDMAKIAKQFFDERWIDAGVREGKAQGAFSASTVPSVHPYVLMNYLGKPRDVMTLAHELGHGVHQWLARDQGVLLASTPLTVAETASVFGEMLTFKALLADTRDQKERKAMIAGKVEDMLNTVVRQIAFYTFERKVHEGRRKGELSSDDINGFWLDVQRESLGPAIELKPGYEVFWTYIPHFINSPFYVYAYAFGDCLVNSLYGLYQDAHPGFVEKYFDLLKAGGSKDYTDLLQPFGLDARDPKFWDKGLSVIEGMIDELEAMDGAA